MTSFPLIICGSAANLLSYVNLLIDKGETHCHCLLVAVSAFVPSSSPLNPAPAESHFIPPPVYCICQACLSIFPWLIVSLLPLFHPPCPFVGFSFFLSVNPTHSLLYCTSHTSSSPLFLSFYVYLTLSPVETRGHGGLTLIDASDRVEDEEGREGWLLADKVNSVFPCFSSPGGN